MMTCGTRAASTSSWAVQNLTSLEVDGRLCWRASMGLVSCCAACAAGIIAVPNHLPNVAINRPLSPRPLDDEDVASTVDWSPCVSVPTHHLLIAIETKRIYHIVLTFLTSWTLRQSSAEVVTATQIRMSMQPLLLSIHFLTLVTKLARRLDIEPCITGQTEIRCHAWGYRHV